MVPRLQYEQNESGLVFRLKQLFNRPEGRGDADFQDVINRVKDLEVCKRLAVECLEEQTREVFLDVRTVDQTLEKIKAYEERSKI